MYVYDAFELGLHSSIQLPELVPGNRPADVIVRYSQSEEPFFSDKKKKPPIQVTSEGIYLFWEGVGEFLVRDGREIIVNPASNVTEQTLRLFILGTTLAMLLYQQGKVVFHASVVDVCGRGVAFVGDKGAGKSTMAVALQARGHKLISDDLLAVDPNQSIPLTLPGFPHMKLWSNTITAIGYSPEDFPQLRPDLNAEKRGYRLDQGHASAPVPLKHIYILDRGLEVEIAPVPPQKALPELMPHWYGARFGVEILQALGLSTHFLQCAQIANSVPVFRLKRPASLSTLPEIARLVEEHVIGAMQPTIIQGVD